ncbi:MAG: Na+/H+ antiporter subunit D [Rhizobiaceae bacterium]|nr:Na+/H+ antiporter subunit D [Rhizobiaceae bacterium]
MATVEHTETDLTVAMITEPAQLVDWLVIAPVALPLILGAALLMARRRTAAQPVLAIASLAVLFAADIGLLWHVLANGPAVMTMGRWLPPFGISFVADALGATLVATAGLVSLVCGFFSINSVNFIGQRYGFYPFLLLMMAGVNGSFLTGDIFNLYVWFEVFLIASFGLIILGSGQRQIDGATKYAILNLVATTLFLIATGYLYGIFGTLNMADIARKAPELRSTAPLMTLATLYLVAFGMKAAAFPLNFWLPASYHTPRIVVAALFAGLLTKVGVYALLRTLVMLFPPERSVLSTLIIWLAIATMLVGILGALAQSDIRRMLGFVVVSGIGFMLAGLGLGDPIGIAGTVVYAVHSMLVMTALYLLAGLMRRAGGSYTLNRLTGLYRSHPLMAGATLLLVFAAAGLPPGSGLWPKVMLVQASLGAGVWWLALAILVTGLLTTLALGRVFVLAFWRMPEEKSGEAATIESQDVGRGTYLAVLVLCVPIALIGVWPEPLIGVAQQAAAGLLDPGSYVGAVFPLETTQ